MSWGLGWKRPTETFRLVLNYGTDEFGDDLNRSSSSSSLSSLSSSSPQAGSSPVSSHQDQEIGFRVDLDWTAGDDEDQVALRLQSQLMVALPSPHDSVTVYLRNVLEEEVEEEEEEEEEEFGNVRLEMKVVKRRELLGGVIVTKAGTGQQSDGVGVLTRLLRSDLAAGRGGGGEAADVGGEGVVLPPGGCSAHWRSVTLLSLYGCGLSVLPPELLGLPLLEKLYLDNNRIAVLPPEVGELKNLKVLSVDYNVLVSVPVELSECVGLVKLSLEHNKLVRPLLDFRDMAELQILRLFGNPLKFLPEILPLHKLRHLSLANIGVVADENLRSVSVQIEVLLHQLHIKDGKRLQLLVFLW